MAEHVIVKTYKGSESAATAAFRDDAVEMGMKGYFPTSQTYAPGTYGCGSFLLALVLCLLIIGFLIFVYMLIVKPDGVLTVTYELREQEAAAAEKPCPRCAETVKAAATMCRFCNYEF